MPDDCRPRAVPLHGGVVDHLVQLGRERERDVDHHRAGVILALQGTVALEVVSDIDLNPATTHDVALNLRCARYVAEARPHLAFSVGGHVEKIKVAELEERMHELSKPTEDVAVVLGENVAEVVLPLLRLARASRAQHDWMFDWMCGDADADVAVGLYDALTEALSAFDFTD